MGVAVDANVLIRWLVRDDAVLAARADGVVDQAKPTSLVLDRLILAETAYVLKSYYQYPKTQVVQNLQVLMSGLQFSVIDRELVEVAVELFMTEAQLSFEDCWLLALKRTGKVTGVHTFDLALQKRL